MNKEPANGVVSSNFNFKEYAKKNKMRKKIGKMITSSQQESYETNKSIAQPLILGNFGKQSVGSNSTNVSSLKKGNTKTVSLFVKTDKVLEDTAEITGITTKSEATCKAKTKRMKIIPKLTLYNQLLKSTSAKKETTKKSIKTPTKTNEFWTSEKLSLLDRITSDPHLKAMLISTGASYMKLRQSFNFNADASTLSKSSDPTSTNCSQNVTISTNEQSHDVTRRKKLKVDAISVNKDLGTSPLVGEVKQPLIENNVEHGNNAQRISTNKLKDNDKIPDALKTLNLDIKTVSKQKKVQKPLTIKKKQPDKAIKPRAPYKFLKKNTKDGNIQKAITRNDKPKPSVPNENTHYAY